jgi:hypothetical protein
MHDDAAAILWVICFGAVGFSIGFFLEYVLKPDWGTWPFCTLILTCLWMYRATGWRRLVLEMKDAANEEE